MLKRRMLNTVRGFRDIMAFDNRWELVLRRLAFRRTGILTYRRKGMEIVVDHHGGDEAGTRACLVSPMYRRLLPTMALSGPLNLLDIGANGGGFALMLADEGYVLNKIAAVEMNPRVFARMQLNITQNLDAKTYLFNAAVTGTARTLETEMGRGSTGESIAGSKGHSSHGDARKVTVEGITFDDVVERAFDPGEVVDICKMDIEGSEYEIFASEHCRHLGRCRYLVVEIHAVANARPETIVAAIERLGLSAMPRAPGSARDVYVFSNPALA